METQGNDHSNKPKLFEVLSLLVAILALLVSIWSAFTGKESTEYQIAEERRPIVTGLNCEIPFQREKSTSDVLDFTNISDKLLPLQIALYNIGPGIAQNCKAEWDGQSVQDAGTQMIDLLENNSSVKIERFSYKQLAQSSWYLYDYLINIEDEDTIVKVLYHNGTEYIAEDFSLQIGRLPYLQSLSINYSPFNLPLPQGFSLLLLEMINQEILTSISLKLSISYQDINGEPFNRNCDVMFTPVLESKTDDEINGYIYISFQTANMQ